MAEEEADAVPFAAAVETPEGAELSHVAFSYWSAWHILSADRPLGAMGGAGRIPFSSIDRYAEKNLFDDPEQLSRMLWAMDSVYLTWLSEKQKNPDAS